MAIQHKISKVSSLKTIMLIFKISKSVLLRIRKESVFLKVSFFPEVEVDFVSHFPVWDTPGCSTLLFVS